MATLNLHWGEGRGGVRFDLAEALRTIDADVVVLQEVWAPFAEPDPVAAVADRLGYEATSIVLHDCVDVDGYRVVAPGASKGTWGMAVLSRRPMAVREVVGLPSGRDPVARKAVIVDVDVGTDVAIVATHLSNRPWAAAVQLRRVARLALEAGASVVAGDLNCPGAVTAVVARPYRRTARRRTWPAHRPLVQLDHVLVAPGVAADGGAVLDVRWSDHRPVRVELELATSS